MAISFEWFEEFQFNNNINTYNIRNQKNIDIHCIV